jgi:hypothetical protein
VLSFQTIDIHMRAIAFTFPTEPQFSTTCGALSTCAQFVAKGAIDKAAIPPVPPLPFVFKLLMLKQVHCKTKSKIHTFGYSLHAISHGVAATAHCAVVQRP